MFKKINVQKNQCSKKSMFKKINVQKINVQKNQCSKNLEI